MGFEPQTANQPLVNPRKRTTKVNFVIVIGVVVFLLIGLYYVVHTARRSNSAEPPAPTITPGL